MNDSEQDNAIEVSKQAWQELHAFYESSFKELRQEVSDNQNNQISTKEYETTIDNLHDIILWHAETIEVLFETLQRQSKWKDAAYKGLGALIEAVDRMKENDSSWRERHQHAKHAALKENASRGGAATAANTSKLRQEAYRLIRQKVASTGKKWPSMRQAAREISQDIQRYAASNKLKPLSADDMQARKTIAEWLGKMDDRATLFASKKGT